MHRSNVGQYMLVLVNVLLPHNIAKNFYYNRTLCEYNKQVFFCTESFCWLLFSRIALILPVEFIAYTIRNVALYYESPIEGILKNEGL